MKPISRREKFIILCLVILIHIILLYFLAHIKQAMAPTVHKPIDFSVVDEEQYPSLPEPEEPWVAHAGDGNQIDFSPEENNSALHKNEEPMQEEPLDEQEELEPEEVVEPEPKKPHVTQQETPVEKPQVETSIMEQPAIRSQSQKKLPTFAELVQGFKNHLQKTSYGGTGIKTESNFQGVVSGKQLAAEHYDFKILSAIINTFRIHRDQFAATANCGGALQFALDRQGNIINLHMVTSTGRPTLDSLILAYVKKAQGSFPPRPAILSKEEIYQFPVINFSSIEALFTAPQGWRRSHTQCQP